MDASQYKDYVLVLLFTKYVSDKYAGRAYAPITIPAGASFTNMVALKGRSDIGDQINKKIIAPLGWGAHGIGFASRAGMGVSRYGDLVAWQLANELKQNGTNSLLASVLKTTAGSAISSRPRRPQHQAI